VRLNDAIAEGQRIMTICNSCRYCEGYCAVFPAMEQRLDFPRADMNYLANLCHNCAECYYACQYAPPHEFASRSTCRRSLRKYGRSLMSNTRGPDSYQGG
jgi:Fe-S oxidoreductase